MKSLSKILLVGALSTSILSVGNQMISNVNNGRVNAATQKACETTIYGFMNAIYYGTDDATDKFFQSSTKSWVDVGASLFDGVEIPLIGDKGGKVESTTTTKGKVSKSFNGNGSSVTAYGFS